jgi:type IV pilus assembly protein PilV
MIEVMMGMAVLAVGATGIVALQKTAALGTLTSRNLTNATSISRSVIEMAESEAGTWTSNTGAGLPTGNWLGTALASPGAWVRPNLSGYSLDLETLDVTAPALPIGYCTHVRATWLGNPTPGPGNTGATAVRLEVRTLFSRAPRDVDDECAAAPTTVTTLFGGTNQTFGGVARNENEYGLVQLTTVIRRNQ